MVSKQFMDRGDVEKTINENPGWQNLSKDNLRKWLKDWLENDKRAKELLGHGLFTEDGKEYILERLKALD